MLITTAWLKKENACADARKWAAGKLNGGKPLAECIAGMERADWLIWLLHRSKAANARQLVKLACVVARFCLRHVPNGEDRPCKAIEAAEAWVRKPNAAAGRAADAARNAAYAAGDAADAAGYAADAARRAADAAWNVACAAEHRKLCSAIRTEIKRPGFKRLRWPV